MIIREYTRPEPNRVNQQFDDGQHQNFLKINN